MNPEQQPTQQPMSTPPVPPQQPNTIPPSPVAAVPSPAYAAPLPDSPVASGSNGKRTVIIASVVGAVLLMLIVAGALALTNKKSGSSTTPVSTQNAPSIGTKADDVMNRTNILSLQTQLEAYYQNSSAYPTLAELNDPAWRKTNLSSLDPQALPSGGFVSNAPTDTAYAYAVGPSGCTNKTETNSCQTYSLSAKLSTGVYTKRSLD